MEPITPWLPLLVLREDKKLMLKVVRALAAVKRCLHELSSFYAQLPDVPVDQLDFSYFRQWRDEFGRSFQLTYILRLSPTKQVFIACLHSEGSRYHKALVLVKFVQGSYGVDTHIRWHANHCAPELLHCQSIPGGWTVVVMEYIDKATTVQDNRPLSAAHFVTVKTAVEALHREDLVHGNIRGCNVLQVFSTSATSSPVNVSSRVALIDFDSAGKVGEARYPAFLNRSDISWPDGVLD